MGLGKTVQALAAIAINQAWPVLLVVPPHLMTNWVRETQRFLRVEEAAGSEPAQIHVIKGLTPYELPPAQIYIIHYLLLRGWKKTLPSLGFETVVFDEIQELRHSGTEKYSAASLISDGAERVYGLSGTPIYNTGGEIYQVMNILDFHCLGDWEGFTREWCYGYGNDIVAHPEQLGEHLRREGLMLRRLKSEVLKQLPAKRRIVQAIDWDESIYQREMQPVYEKLNQLMAMGSEGEAAQTALIKEQIVAGERQATGISKAPWVCAFVRALLEAGERVLLFAHHHSVFDIYRRELTHYRPAFITGRETPAQKDNAVGSFMDGKTQLCCISLRAASGLNLQAATCTVFGELDWSPAVHSQAEDRAHRMGKEDSLICYYLVCAKGTDQDMQDALGLKVSQFKGLMGEEEKADTLEDTWAAQRHMDQVITRLQDNRNKF
jgi:SNF2 family DNA or RNA helicase